MIDYLIVGCGLAGISFSEVALKNNRSILVFDNNSQNSSKIAAGLYNPVILKRFSQVLHSEEHLLIMNDFFDSLESKLECKVNFPLPILRKFFSVEEQNNWFIASDKVSLTPFLSPTIVKKKYNGIDSPFGFGEVLRTGYVDTELLITKYKNYLLGIKSLIVEAFDYNKLELLENGIRYKNINARHIIFAEGFGMHNNPFFYNLPLDGTKGELLIIIAPLLNLDVIINTSLFILPLGNDLYKVGATYNWVDKTSIPTEEGKWELIEKIKELICCDFEIVEHLAAVRPTVKDRRPLLGTSLKHNSIHILNGLGTRGVMLGPAMAKTLFVYIENQIPIEDPINIRRFCKLK